MTTEMAAAIARHHRARRTDFDEHLFLAAVRQAHARGERPLPPEVKRAWLTLVAEGICMGGIRSADDESWSSFTELALLSWAPQGLPALGSAHQLQCLTTLFNLAEGLRAHAGWMDRFVLARAPRALNLEQVEAWLTHELTPLIEPDADVRWHGSWSARWVDCTPFAPDFLPGRMQLITPTVVSVADRRHPGRALALHVGPGGDHTLLGEGPTHPDPFDAQALPTVELAPGRVTVGDQQLALPAVQSPREAIAVPSGVVVVSAEDSQRLWLLAVG